jgi:hypothetical protein
MVQKPPMKGQMPPLWYWCGWFCWWRPMYRRHMSSWRSIGRITERSGVGIAGAGGHQRLHHLVRHGLAGQAVQHRQHIAEHIALVADEREVHEAQVQHPDCAWPRRA